MTNWRIYWLDKLKIEGECKIKLIKTNLIITGKNSISPQKTLDLPPKPQLICPDRDSYLRGSLNE
jgi:hypothetical protein